MGRASVKLGKNKTLKKLGPTKKIVKKIKTQEPEFKVINKLDKMNRNIYMQLKATGAEDFEPPWNSEDAESVLDFLNDGKSMFAVDKSGRFVGYARRKNNKKLESLYINPAYQKKGLGSRLLNKFETFAEQKGEKETLLLSLADALPFYGKHGYKSRPDKSKYHLRKDLDEDIDIV